jgi:hypothetical protein
VKKISDEWVLDWYNTRGGRTIVKPCFGERVSVHHLLEKAPAKERLTKEKKTCKDKLTSKGYTRTYIETNKGMITLNKVVVFRECVNIFQGVRSVYYEDRRGMFSKQFNS